MTISNSEHQLWASGYEIYDRLSPSMAALLEGLTATHDAKFFLEEAARLGNPLRSGYRGSPLNHGSELQAVHPVIRTNRRLALRLGDQANRQCSCHRLEERVREQGFHEADQRGDEG